MKLRLWAFDEERKNRLHDRPVPKATPFFFSDDTFFSIETFYTFTLRVRVTKASLGLKEQSSRIIETCMRLVMLFWTILPLRVYMPCYVHNFRSRAHSVLKTTKIDEIKSPLTCRSHQDPHQPLLADPEQAAAVAVEVGKADTLGTHPEAVLPAAVVAAERCAQAWVAVASSIHWLGSRATCVASAGPDRAFAAVVAVAVGRKGRSHLQQRARRLSVGCQWVTRNLRCRVLAGCLS